MVARPRLILAGLQSVARRLIAPLRPGWPDAGRRIVQRPVLRKLLSLAAVSGRPVRRALNAGSGEGLFSSLLLTLSSSPLIVELDVSYPFRRRRSSPRQVFGSATLTHLPLATSSVDLVFCTEVLEHIEDDIAAVSEMRRVLTPGGWILISVPTPPAEYDAAHVREGYTAAQLSALLGGCGLRVVETSYSTRFFFRRVLRHWRPGLLPRFSIQALALLDRVFPVGPPMNLYALARLEEPLSTSGI